jgi:hypothetical protein
MIGHKVSIDTKNKMSNSAKKHGFGKLYGANHPNWKGGVTPKNVQVRGSGEYVNWRNSVFKRDHWTCQQCRNVGGNIVAHHILPFAKYKTLRFEITNGITLCEACHLRLHRITNMKGIKKYG